MVKCKKCGRVLSGEYDYCRACGSPLGKVKRNRPDNIIAVLGGDAKIGGHSPKVWLVTLATLAAVALLAGLYNGLPKLISALTTKADELIPEQEVVVEPVVTPINKVSGTIIYIPDEAFDSCALTTEKAYSDGSWERDMTVNDTIKFRLLRCKTAGDNWVNTHIFELYPDVLEAESYPESATISGWPSARIFIAQTAEAEGYSIEVVRTTDGTYDYLCIMEIPTDSFEQYESSTNRWAASLMLVDADTLAECRHVVSQSDASSADAA